MRRAGLIAAGVVGVVVLAGLGAWLALFRDTADPVTVEDAVASFRMETDGSASASPIPPGVYVYGTDGSESTDALTGVTHRYPNRSTITVAAAECGASFTWRVLKGRSTEWRFCLTDDGWQLRAQDERHTLYGRTERTTYICKDTPILPSRHPRRQLAGRVGDRRRERGRHRADRRAAAVVAGCRRARALLRARP